MSPSDTDQPSRKSSSSQTTRAPKRESAQVAEEPKPSLLRDYGSLPPGDRRGLRILALTVVIAILALFAFAMWRGVGVRVEAARVVSIQIEGRAPANR